MLIQVVSVFVKPEAVEAFITATRKNHLGSRTEPGNRRFDLVQSTEDATRFILYEVFESQAAIDAHRQTPHYQAWKAAVEPLMQKPREARLHRGIFPEPDKAW